MRPTVRQERHAGPFPQPIETLERLFAEGGTTLLRAAFENTFFLDPAVVRERPCYFPDRARISREHHPGQERGEWVDAGVTKIRLGDNRRAQTAFAKYAGRPLARASGFGVRHIWGRPWEPAAFTAGWNMAYMPFWAGMLTEKQHPHPILERAVRQASWDLYFRDESVCPPPAYVVDPGLDLAELLRDRPLLILGRPLGTGHAATGRASRITPG